MPEQGWSPRLADVMADVSSINTAKAHTKARDTIYEHLNYRPFYNYIPGMGTCISNLYFKMLVILDFSDHPPQNNRAMPERTRDIWHDLTLRTTPSSSPMYFNREYYSQ